SSRRRHTRFSRDWSSDVCSSDLQLQASISGAQADQIDAEGRDDLNASQISGSATGETHTLRTGGTSPSDPKTSAEVTTVNGDNRSEERRVGKERGTTR